MYIGLKINQSIFKSSWVSNLAKCIHGMCENNERYDCKTTRWIQKTMKCMWILNINDAWKKNRLVKCLKTEIFSVSIGRASIGCQSSKVEARLEKFGNFQLIENYTRSIEILENWIFWKNHNFFCRINFQKIFHDM